MNKLVYLSLVFVLLISTCQAQDFFTRFISSSTRTNVVYAAGFQSVLFGTQLTQTDAGKLVATISTQVANNLNQRNLTYIVLLSDRPEDFLGVNTVLQSFPNAQVVATPAVAAALASTAPATLAALAASGAADLDLTPLPRVTPLSSFSVGGTNFQLFDYDFVNSRAGSYAWIDSKRTLIANDLVSNGVHLDLSYTVGPRSFEKYALVLNTFLTLFSPITTLYPEYGPTLNGDGDVLNMVRLYSQYLQDFVLAVQPPNTRAQALATMVFKYPTLTLGNLLQKSINAAIPDCVPQCQGKTCGSDGCGGTCGSCTAPFSCNSCGQCHCASNCTGKFCGDDGCGKTCGSCKFGTCTAAGTCACTPSCPANSCGSDGCGGVCKCASGLSCTSQLTCVAPSGASVGVGLGFNNVVTYKPSCSSP